MHAGNDFRFSLVRDKLNRAAIAAILQARDGFQQLFLSAAGDTGDAENLAAVRGEVHVAKAGDSVFIAHVEVFDDQTRLWIDRLGTLDIQRNSAANHHLGEFHRVGFRGRHIADIVSFAQNRNAVGDLHDLVQLMGNDDDRLSVVLHVAHDAEELLRFLRRENGGRFVENQNISAAVKHLDDFKRLLFRDGHVIHFLVGVNDKTVTVANLLDRFAHAL